MKKLSLICVALLLSACGGGGGGGGGSTTVPPAPGPAPTPTTDAFYAQLIGIVFDQPDTVEAGDVSMLMPTAPEDTEPTPL